MEAPATSREARALGSGRDRGRLASNRRPHDRQRLARALARDPIDLEPGFLDRALGVAAEPAASGDVPPKGIEAALPSEAARIGGGDVLEEDEATARAEDALHLGE